MEMIETTVVITTYNQKKGFAKMNRMEKQGYKIESYEQTNPSMSDFAALKITLSKIEEFKR